MVIVPGGMDRLSAAVARAIWVSSQSGQLPEALARWVVRELAFSDTAVAEALVPEWQVQLPEQEPEIIAEEPGVVVGPALVQALTDVLYALDRVSREPEGTAVAEVVGTRWALLGRLARTYSSIRELLTPVSQLPWLLGAITPGMGRGRGGQRGEIR